MHLALAMSVFCMLFNAENKRVHTQCRLDFIRTCCHDLMDSNFLNGKPLASHRPTFKIVGMDTLSYIY